MDIFTKHTRMEFFLEESIHHPITRKLRFLNIFKAEFPDNQDNQIVNSTYNRLHKLEFDCRKSVNHRHHYCYHNQLATMLESSCSCCFRLLTRGSEFGTKMEEKWDSGP